LIIDAHIHGYPPEILADPSVWGRNQSEPWWTQAVAPTNRPSIQGWADLDRLIRDMDKAGIEKAVLLGWYWEQQSSCDIQNRYYIDCIRQHPDRLTAFATVQPAAGANAIDQLQRSLDAGLSGIGEILPQVQRFRFEDEYWQKIIEIAIKSDLPVYMHVSDSVAVSPAVMPSTHLRDYVTLASEFPEAKFIFAHWGGGLPFFELNKRVRTVLKNVWYDTAASPLLYINDVFRHVIDLVGVNRILYGSDYPLLVYPRETREVGFSRFIEEVKGLDLLPDEKAAILGGNAAKLFRFGR
jgi:predicted TIM-barrel fold metal-dependent hydrolase